MECKNNTQEVGGVVYGLPVIVSSVWDANHAASHCRLNFIHPREDIGASAWAAGILDTNQWIQISSERKRHWVAISTQGRHWSGEQWVTKYKVIYSNDGASWHDVDCGKVFTANTDRNTIVTQRFDHPFKARQVRLLPTEWHGHISLRAEFTFSTKDHCERHCKKGSKLPSTGVYYIYSNKNNSHVLACNDGGQIVTTGNRVKEGWEGFILENVRDNLYFISRYSRKNLVLSCNPQGGIITTPNKVAGASGWEGFRLEQSDTEDVWFIVSDANNAHVLACNDGGGIQTTGNRVSNGWEGWRFARAEPSPNVSLCDGTYFIYSHKNNGHVLACNDGGQIVTTGNKVKDGWEGFDLRRVGYEFDKSVFFLSSHKISSHVLACNPDGQIITTPNRVREGWEGWVIRESNISGVYFIISNVNFGHVLACNDGGGIQTTGNRVPDGWEGFHFQLC